MKNLLIAAACILFSTMFSSAQSIYQLGESLDFLRSHKMHTGDLQNMLTESDINGSPYLNDEFIIGTIFTTTEMQFQDIPLRYNIYSGKLEFKTPENEVLALAAPEIVKRAEFGEFKLSYITYSLSKKIKRGFFEELVNGKVSLFTKAEILYQKPTKPAAYKDAEPAKFIERPNLYFLKVEKESAKKIDNKKGLIEMFPDNREQVATFIKKNKIKVNKEDQLIELVTYYNSL